MAHSHDLEAADRFVTHIANETNEKIGKLTDSVDKLVEVSRIQAETHIRFEEQNNQTQARLSSIETEVKDLKETVTENTNNSIVSKTQIKMAAIVIGIILTALSTSLINLALTKPTNQVQNP